MEYIEIVLAADQTFEVLKDKVDNRFIDDAVVKLLNDNLLDKCKFVKIEFPYYDSDYLSSYYEYYSKKHKKLPKECYRILFFKDEKFHEIMGYITLRPTYEQAHIGRIYFEPNYIVKEASYIITSKNKVHISGEETYLDIFPQMGQDSDFCVCAHVTAWAILRHFSNKFKRYPEITMGGLSEKIEWNYKAPLPSYGLSSTQISNVFHEFGYSSLCIFEEAIGNESFMEELFSYLNSGIPIVGGMVDKKHAISIIGYGQKQSDYDSIQEYFYETVDNQETNIAIADKFMKSLIVNDDRRFPYEAIERTNREGDEYSISDINYIVVPLYDRVTLLYEHVKQALLEYSISDQWKSDKRWPEKYLARIFLTSANSYKEYFTKNKRDLEKDMYSAIMELNMPKLIWVVELSTFENYKADKVDHIVLLDSTSSKLAEDKFLFIAAENYALYRSEFEEKSITLTMKSMGISRFDCNLTKVELV